MIFMLTTGKDHRITKPFIEGSDHRNLSVIILNQHIYYY